MLTVFRGLALWTWAWAGLGAVEGGLGGSGPVALSDEAAAARWADPAWRLAWADEFEVDGLPEADRWGHEVGRVRNREAQFYTAGRPENARVEAGHLVITARAEVWEGADFTSASLTSRRPFTFGKVEVRARVPGGRGTWPAIWTLGTNIGSVGWPRCGEIDILEHVGFDPPRLHFTVHTEAFNHVRGTQRGASVVRADAVEGWHTYGILWEPNRIEWFFDGAKVFEFVRRPESGVEEWPFTEPQYLILNLAVGGTWGGQQGIDAAAFPAEFRIDYVRVWERP